QIQLQKKKLRPRRHHQKLFVPSAKNNFAIAVNSAASNPYISSVTPIRNSELLGSLTWSGTPRYGAPDAPLVLLSAQLRLWSAVTWGPFLSKFGFYDDCAARPPRPAPMHSVCL